MTTVLSRPATPRPASPSGRRTDLTPCLLHPELLVQGGGLARAILERASLYARHYERVLILTTGFNPRQDAAIAELRARGSLDDRVVVRNFYVHSAWAAGIGTPPAGAVASGEEGVVSTLQRLPGGPARRVADRRNGERQPFRYRYFDRRGLPLATTRTSGGHKHEQRGTLHGATEQRVGWGELVARWVDDELEGLPGPVLFSLQRGFGDPVLLATTRPVRKVASLHNCHYVDPEDPGSGVRDSFAPLLARPGLIDEIVCLTDQQRRDLVRDVPGVAVRSIPYPGRPGPGEPAAKDPDLVVLVAQLIDRKRVDHAIRAFRTVVDAVPRARLDVYGEGPEQARLEALVMDLGLAGSVRLMGYSLQVGAAQAAATCTLMTSTFEGYARVITESMSRGTPVVSYDVRYGPRDLIRDGVDGVLVRRHEPDALAAAILRVLADRKGTAAMGVRAREVLARLPVEDFERTWLRVLTGEDPPSRWTAAAVAALARARLRRIAVRLQRRLRRA